MARARRLRGAALHDFHNRETTWARQTSVVTLAANANYATTDLLSAFKTAGGNTQGTTVTRTHLTWSVTTVVAANDQFCWGTLRGQNTDVGANVAGAPAPDVDPYEDWNMWRYETASASAGSGPTYWPATNNRDFDVKAQRRIMDLNMSYNLVVKRVTVAAATLVVVVTSSVLLKLP